METTQRILVPIDFSRASQAAFEWALQLAGTKKGTILYILNIVPEQDDEQLMTAGDETLLALRHEDIPVELRRWVEKVPKGVRTEAFYVHGDVAQQIASACQDYEVDVVIMASDVDGYETWSDDVATDTIRLCQCPVWVMYTRSAPVTLRRAA